MIRPRDSAAAGQHGFGIEADILASLLQVITTAWSLVRRKGVVRARSHETEIAGELVSEMRAEKDRRGLHFLVEEESGTRSWRATKPDGRIDVKIFFLAHFHESKFFGIECKRVNARRRALAQKYVANGVLRFVAGKYGHGHKLGMLIGFAVDQNSAGSAARIADEIAAQNANLRMLSQWNPVVTRGSIPHLYMTAHDRLPPDCPITLLHLLLDI